MFVVATLARRSVLSRSVLDLIAVMLADGMSPVAAGEAGRLSVLDLIEAMSLFAGAV